MKFNEADLIAGSKLHKELREREERLGKVFDPIDSHDIDEQIEEGVRELINKLGLDRPGPGEIV